MLRSKLFSGVEQELIVYNGQAIQNETIEFFIQEGCEAEEEDYSFPGYVSSYFRIYNERLGTEIKEFALSQSGSSLVINVNATDMTFDVNGLYYYEIGYNNGYDIALRYGKLQVV